MSVAHSAPLSDLSSLDRSKLHVFIVGPGQGEALAIALPEAGWLFVDCCRVGDDLPQETLWTRYRKDRSSDPVRLVGLTHPHADHADGFADLLAGCAPDLVAVTGNPPPQRDLVRAIESTLRGPQHRRRLAQTVQAAAKAIHEWERISGRSLLALCDGQQLIADSGRVTAVCRAPTAEEISKLLDDEHAITQLTEKANHLSAVIELIYGRTRLVLGGDLPRYESREPLREVPTGWNTVLVRHPHLGKHEGLKLPHHGSKYAFHEALHTQDDPTERAWLLTPYNKSGLPRTGRMEGLEQLLDRQPALYLTAPPAARERHQRWPHPALVPVAELDLRIQHEPVGHPWLDRGHDVRSTVPIQGLDAVWCVAWDDAGRLVGRWRGSLAIEVTK